MAKKKDEGESTAKKSNKKVKKLQITYNPRFSPSEKKTVILREPVQVAVGNTFKTEYKPIIDGLPTSINHWKSEKKEVTLEQFKKLYELGYIDTPEDNEEREKTQIQYSTWNWSKKF